MDGWVEIENEPERNVEDTGESAEHDRVFALVVDYLGGPSHSDLALSLLQENYEGAFDDLADWAEHQLSERGLLEQVPDELRSFINFDSYAQSAVAGGTIFSIRDNGKLHIFRS